MVRGVTEAQSIATWIWKEFRVNRPVIVTGRYGISAVMVSLRISHGGDGCGVVAHFLDFLCLVYGPTNKLFTPLLLHCIELSPKE